MSRISNKTSAAVRCDMPNCVNTFTTYSFASLVRAQALNAGWRRVRGSSFIDAEGYILGPSTRKVDLCPTCQPEKAPRAKRESKAAEQASVQP